MTRQIWREWNLFYVEAKQRRPKPDSCQTHQHIPTTWLHTPNSHQTQTPPDPITESACHKSLLKRHSFSVAKDSVYE
jgi:hypothetical protein